LLCNAAKFTFEGSVTLEAKIRSQIDVSDIYLDERYNSNAENLIED
jgi:hypothetical protein